MKIIQLTDLHIGAPHEATNGVDVLHNIKTILSEIFNEQPDYLVLTGDFCFNRPHPFAYTWLAEQLAEVSIPIRVIGGNHDDIQLLADTFRHSGQLKKDSFYYSDTFGGIPFLFLDSHTNAIDEQQLDWLQAQLAVSQEVYLFVHHPIMLAQHRFMDAKYPLRNHAAVTKILHEHSHPVYAFCGHYHTDKVIHSRNIHLHITPSCILQIASQPAEFTIDHYRVGYRIIQIDANKTLTTEVRYVDV
ncbi:MAG: metallophosphoesterase [Saprospiraceae bacterium]|nr:metallophosphoesterase [Saprospiraceae bacterium]MBP7680046.1 metallophosphoesterase [Saprospiraceae bacterium]